MSLTPNQQTFLAALRSGNYEQARGALRKGDAFCCLGVACDVYLQETGDGRWGNRQGNFAVAFIADVSSGAGMPESAGAYLPLVVQRWLGINDKDPFITAYSSAAQLNDDYQKNFAEIANFFEEYFLKVNAEGSAVHVSN